ncbi:MAG: hypothetical protein KTR31_25695 [Myxococcales bacterium]|nr:hypothetical protein [Myxococcales bacterium]
MPARYHHTQVGLVISLVTVGLLGGLGLWFLWSGAALLAGVLACVGVAVLVAFGALTVRIEGTQLQARFGVGVIRRRIDLGEVVAAGRVRNRWYYGWGIRLTPSGWMWSTSGLDAVELRFRDGRAFRLGTDEPDALVAAIRAAAPHVEALSAEHVAGAERGARAALLAVGGSMVVVLGVVGVLFALNLQPLEVSVGASELTVDGGIYTARVHADQITEVTLLEQLPPIRRRTNGFALGGTLRGHFQLDGLGAGRLFLQRDKPPFVLVRTSLGYVIFNAEEPARTRELYEALRGVTR